MIKRYNEESSCVKCGTDKPTSRYVPAKFMLNHLVLVENIERTCRNCGYTWAELPLDSKEKTND